jgi:predicted DCC family thiol-disulfide oxidoreductase YuxK
MKLSKSKSNFTKDSPHLVFYDDKCALCSAEINHYRKLKTCHPIKWIGIYQNQEILKQFGFERNQLLERLHVIRGDGAVLIGASAFATIWCSINRYRLLGYAVYKLRLIPTLNYIYTHFAKWRYQKQVCEI